MEQCSQFKGGLAMNQAILLMGTARQAETITSALPPSMTLSRPATFRPTPRTSARHACFQATPEAERDALMSWFGYGLGGRTVEVIPGETRIPEWSLVDPAQNRRAIEDPEGYRTRINSQQVTAWGRVKVLYR